MSSGRMPSLTHHAESFDKRAKVVVANGTPLSVRIRFGRPYSLKQPREDRLGLVDGRRRRRLATQEIATEPVGDRQRIAAILAVTRSEVALVVGAPDVVGR